MASKISAAPAMAAVASVTEGFRAPVVSHRALTSAAAQVLAQRMLPAHLLLLSVSFHGRQTSRHQDRAASRSMSRVNG